MSLKKFKWSGKPIGPGDVDCRYECGCFQWQSVPNVVCYELVCYERVCYERVCYERGSVMNVVCFQMWSVMNVVCYEGVYYEGVCSERVCYDHIHIRQRL